MRFSLLLITATTLFIGSGAIPVTSTRDVATNRVAIQRAHGQRIPGSYIVTFKPTVDKSLRIEMAEQEDDVRVTHTRWNAAVFNGFAGIFSGTSHGISSSQLTQ